MLGGCGLLAHFPHTRVASPRRTALHAVRISGRCTHGHASPPSPSLALLPQIITQGKPGSTFYVIDSGEYSAHLKAGAAGTPQQ